MSKKVESKKKGTISKDNQMVKIISESEKNMDTIMEKAEKWKSDLKTAVLMSRGINIDTFEQDFQKTGRKIKIDDMKFMYKWSIKEYKKVMNDMISEINLSISKFNEINNSNISIDEIENTPHDYFVGLPPKRVREIQFELAEEIVDDSFSSELIQTDKVAFVDTILCHKTCDYMKRIYVCYR